MKKTTRFLLNILSISTMKNSAFFAFLLCFGLSALKAQVSLPVSATFSSATTTGPGTIPAGFTHAGLGGYAVSLKFDTQDDWLQLSFNSSPGILSFDIGVNNSFPGTIPANVTFSILQSLDGLTWTNVTVVPSTNYNFILWDGVRFIISSNSVCFT